MTARVLGYLTSLLPPWSGRFGDRPAGRRRRIASLLREFESLDSDKQQEVARALAQLWDSFVEQFGGIDGFLGGDEARRREYIQRLQAAARRMSEAKSSDKGHYYFATAMLALYLRALGDGSNEDHDQRIAGLVVTLIDRGRKLPPPARSLH